MQIYQKSIFRRGLFCVKDAAEGVERTLCVGRRFHRTVKNAIAGYLDNDLRCYLDQVMTG